MSYERWVSCYHKIFLKNKSDFIKIKKKHICASNSGIKQVKSQPTQGEKYLQILYLLRVNIQSVRTLTAQQQKNRKTSFKNEQNIWIEILSKIAYKCPISTSNNVQHHW